MAFDVPTTEPDALTAGDTWQWTKQLADYPVSEGWTLTYYVSGPISLVPIVADTADDRYTITVAASVTAGAPPGTYRWEAKVSLAGVVHRVGSGVWTVARDMATAKSGDALTHEERAIPLLELAIERRVGADLKSYSLTSRAVTKEELRDLRMLLSQCRRVVWQRRNPGKMPMRTVRYVN